MLDHETEHSGRRTPVCMRAYLYSHTGNRPRLGAGMKMVRMWPTPHPAPLGPPRSKRARGMVDHARTRPRASRAARRWGLKVDEVFIRHMVNGCRWTVSIIIPLLPITHHQTEHMSDPHRGGTSVG